MQVNISWSASTRAAGGAGLAVDVAPGDRSPLVHPCADVYTSATSKLIYEKPVVTIVEALRPPTVTIG